MDEYDVWTVPRSALGGATGFSTGTSMDLLLASTSPIRGTLLANAGVPYGAVRPEVDEAAVKAGFAGSDAELAIALAEAKALSVSRTRPETLVIGSDSIVSVEGRRF